MNLSSLALPKQKTKGVKKKRQEESEKEECDDLPDHLLFCIPDRDNADAEAEEKEEEESHERRTRQKERKKHMDDLEEEVKKKVPVSQAKKILYRILDQIDQNSIVEAAAPSSTREKIQNALEGKQDGKETVSGQIKIPTTVCLDPSRSLKLKEEAMEAYHAYQRMYALHHDAAVRKQAAESADEKLRKLLEHIQDPTDAEIENARFLLESKRASSLAHLVPKKGQVTREQIIDARQANRIKNNKIYQTHTFLCTPNKVY